MNVKRERKRSSAQRLRWANSLLVGFVVGLLAACNPPLEDEQNAPPAGVVQAVDPLDPPPPSAPCLPELTSPVDIVKEQPPTAVGLGVQLVKAGDDKSGTQNEPGRDGHEYWHKENEFGVLLEEGDAGLFKVARRLTRGDFEKYHELLSSNGLVLHDFEIVSESQAPDPCFTGIWYAGLAAQSLELKLPLEILEESLAGKTTIDVETYTMSGTRLFAGVWQEGPADQGLLMDVGDDEVLELPGSSREIRDIESWFVASEGEDEGEWHHMVVHTPAQVTQDVRLRQTSTDFGDSLKSPDLLPGHRPRELEIDVVDGVSFYTSIWENSEEPFWLFVGAETLQDCRIVSLGVDPSDLEPHALEACRDGEDVSFGPNVLPAPEPLRNPLRILDFVFSREGVESWGPNVIPHHAGVIHDTGPSGPG